jgi:hypothetical protein
MAMETRLATVPSLDRTPNILWTGCGDLLRKSDKAVRDLIASGARFVFTDRTDNVRQPPPENCPFFNISLADERERLRKLLRSDPLTHIYVATWPDVHLLTSFKYSDHCPGGTIIIPKPLDTNFELIETLASDAFPEINEKIFVYDHYRNKSVIEQLYQAFPKLIQSYGEVMEFEMYLLEYQTIEQECRQRALAKGVIFDLASHLLALVQLFFLDRPHIGLLEPRSVVKHVDISINQVARARYTHCQLPHNIETFSAIDITLHVHYRSSRGESSPRPIRGLLVVGKGVKPGQSLEADLKGLRLTFAIAPRAANFSRGTINPPLTDLDAFKGDMETGYYRPVVESLSNGRPVPASRVERLAGVPVLMNFAEARTNAVLLRKAILSGSAVTHYRTQKDTLREILAECVSQGHLDAKWLPRGEFGDIGYN